MRDLHLRKDADPHAPDALEAPDDKMPEGSIVEFDPAQKCKVWVGSGRAARDADNVWCPVQYGNYRGWANAYFLAMSDGRRVACVMYPGAKGCPLTLAANPPAQPELPPPLPAPAQQAQKSVAEPIVLECELSGEWIHGSANWIWHCMAWTHFDR
jgi:hypothetical protein